MRVRGDGGDVQVFSPADWGGEGLAVSFQALGAGERLAVVLLNESSVRGVAVEANARGTRSPLEPTAARALAAPAPAPADPMAAALARGRDRARALAARGLARAPEAAAMAEDGARFSATAAPLPGDRGSFCAYVAEPASDRDTGFRRTAATLRAVTPHALLWVADVSLPGFSRYEACPEVAPGDVCLWERIEAAYEEHVLPALLAGFGPLPDRDGDGRTSFFFYPIHTEDPRFGVTVGFFYPPDVIGAFPADPTCDRTGSSGVDVLHLIDVGRFEEAFGLGAGAALADGIYPSIMAHELQHAANQQARCAAGSCLATEEDWLNEALSMVAEDAAGYGLQLASTLDATRAYLGRREPSGSYLNYADASLRTWDGDPVGNYEGARLFLRYFVDRHGADLTRALVEGGERGVRNFEAAWGEPLPRARLAQVASLLLSNEAASPTRDFDLSGAAWTPFHDKVSHLHWEPLGSTPAAAALRELGGVAVLLSGPGSGGRAEVVLQARAAAPKPWVAVLRVRGDLPLPRR